MIREDRFVLSRRQYAVLPETYRVREKDGYMRADAVWFRRRRGVTVACRGYLWDYNHGGAAATCREFLENFRDGAYGGQCEARWDGRAYWHWESPRPEQIEQDLALLLPMLESYPAIPPGYEGWWRFPSSRD